MKSMIDTIIEKMKTTEDDVPLILVGGGSSIIPPNIQFEGIYFYLN